MGVHQWDLRIGKAIENAKVLSLLPIHLLFFPLTMVQFFHFTVGVYAIAIIPLKIAIILQIRRIFTPMGHSSRSQRTLRWIMDLFLVLNVIFYLTLVLFQFLVCQPLEAAWNPFVPGKCLADRFVMHIISAAINTASDLILIMLPQPVIWSLNMNWRRQLGLSAVFLVGAGYVSLYCTAARPSNMFQGLCRLSYPPLPLCPPLLGNRSDVPRRAYGEMGGARTHIRIPRRLPTRVSHLFQIHFRKACGAEAVWLRFGAQAYHHRNPSDGEQQPRSDNRKWVDGPKWAEEDQGHGH
jgi:hypothetical protein